MKIKTLFTAIVIMFSLIGCDKENEQMADVSFICPTFSPEGGPAFAKVLAGSQDQWEIKNKDVSSWINYISQITGKGNGEITISTEMKNETKTEKITSLQINNSTFRIFQAFQIHECDLLGTWESSNTTYTFKKDGKYIVKFRNSDGQEIEFEQNYKIKWNEVAGFIIYSIDDKQMTLRDLYGRQSGRFNKKIVNP